MAGPTALVDAAIVYGAERILSGAHEDPAWPYRSAFKREDDERLFRELLHQLALYDALYLDKSSLSEDIPNEIFSLCQRINGKVGLNNEIGIIRIFDASSMMEASPHMVQRSFCRYVSARINANYQLADRLLNVRIPWAYHQPDHHDRREMQSNFGMAGLDERYLPFVLFAWRGLMYGAIAHSERKRGDLFGAGGTTSSPSGDPRLASYVAAPGRILALREVLAADDMERFDFPNEAWRSLIFDLQDLPPHGYDFSFLKSLPAVDTSPIALLASEREPQDALEYVLDWRATREGRKLMFDWYELLGIGFRGTIVGSTNIQIAKNINVGGDFNQMVVARPR